MKRPNLKTIILFGLPLLVALAAAILFSNKGFHYSEFRPFITVSIKSEDSIKQLEVYTKISELSNIAKVDKESSTVYFQNIFASDLKPQIDNITKDYSEVRAVFTESSALHRSTLAWFTIGVIAFVLVSIALHFYFVYSKSRATYEIIGNTYVIYTIVILLTNFLVLGLLSIVSKVYFVNAFNLTTIFVCNLFILAYFLKVSWKFKYEQEFIHLNNLFELSENRDLFSNLIKVLLIILVCFSLALGVGFIFNSILIIGFIFTAIGSMYFVSKIQEIELSKPVQSQISKKKSKK